MSRWGELITHDDELAEEGRCLCDWCDYAEPEAPVSD
jgi:hypothetical protein